MPEMHWPEGTFLGRLTGPARDAVVAIGRPERLSDGEDVLVEGTTSASLVLLMQGWFKVLAALETGRDSLLAFRVGGDLVGELGGMDGEPRIATVRALGESRVRIVPRRDFLSWMERFPESRPVLNRVIADRLRVATRRQVEFANCSASTRVARVLAELMTSYGRPVPGGILVSVLLSQPELAALVGATEPTVHRILSELRADRVLETGYRRILIVDEARLLERAGT